MYKRQLSIILTTASLAITSVALAEEDPSTELRTGKNPGATIAESIQTIVKRGLTPGKDEAAALAVTSDALGLLATGEKKHLKMVQTYAHNRAKACEALDVMENQAFQPTEAGLLNILLCEYYLLTKDKEVMPGIKALSTYLAFGQSGVGTWGTEMPDVKKNGLYGQAAGIAANENWGSDNNVTLVAATSLVLSRKCGVETKPVLDAIERSSVYLRYFAGKGGIPINLPKPHKEHNGGNRSAHAAILFHLLGEKGPAKFFTQMAAADTGHGGRFEVKWSEAGNQLLDMCHSRGVLKITSKDATGLDLLSKKELQESVEAGAFNAKEATDEELIEALGSWSMPVRHLAGKQLGKRKVDVTDKLLAMLKSKHRFERYGACEGFRFTKKPPELVGHLTRILQNDTDETMLHYALYAIGIRYGKGHETDEYRAAAMKAVPAFTEVVTRDYPGKDPQNRIGMQVAETLIVMLHRAEFSPYFYRGEGMKEVVPTEKLIPLLKEWLNCPYGNARVAALRVSFFMSEKELEPLYEDIYFSCINGAPGRGTKSSGLNLMGYKALGHLRFKEGLELTLAEMEKGGGMGAAMSLTSYTLNNLKPHWDKIEPVLKPFMDKEKHGGHSREWKEIWDKKLAETETSELRSIKPYLSEARIKASKRLFPKDFE